MSDKIALSGNVWNPNVPFYGTQEEWWKHFHSIEEEEFCWFAHIIMKKYRILSFLIITVLWTVSSVVNAQNTPPDDSKIRYIDASQLTLIGKIAPTPILYHRVDSARYPGLSKSERRQVRHSSGLALVFRTNSPELWIKTIYAEYPSVNFISFAGYDLYIKSGKEWLYAFSASPSKTGAPLRLIANMDTSEKECLLYLPTYSELSSVEIGVTETSTIKACENPFRHKIVLFGSSYAQGANTGRAGMSFPTQIERNTGLYIINLGVSGSSRLQPVFADIMADSDAEAFIIDAFSNPLAPEIEKRLLPFIERIRQSHPKTPLIFLQTIYREGGNFDLVARKQEEDKRRAAERMMKIAMEKYQDVYFINVPNLTGTDHQTSTDGTHPSDLGYYRWVQNIQPKILKILAKYGIK
jgi:lysophospholipase L1-like esterase